MRLAYRQNQTPLHRDDTLVLKGRNGKERELKPVKWFLNRNTPVGEPADLYERKPYGGRRLVDWDELIAIIKPD